MHFEMQSSREKRMYHDLTTVSNAALLVLLPVEQCKCGKPHAASMGLMPHIIRCHCD